MGALEQLAGRRILFLNWRDRGNPAAGGAESYTEQIAQRLVDNGALLTLFTSTYPGAAPYEWLNGYLVIRRGGRFGVYLAAARHLQRYSGHYDAVVDFQNGIPFFAPCWVPVGKPVICVVHHVHQRQFDMYFRWPLNHFGRLLEGPVSRWVYGRRPLIAVSPSTRADMRSQLRLRGAVHIVPNGIDPPRPDRIPRAARPAIAIVTRLVPHKQLHHLVDAVPELLRRWPDLRVDIAGEGTTRGELLAQVHRLGLEDTIFLPGRISEQSKEELLERAWLTVAPSLSEGWGLTVIEANAAGTPAVAYDVPGLRDSVRHGTTGWLVPPGQRLATALGQALSELGDPDRQSLIDRQARAWAARFSWDRSAEHLARVLLSEMRRREQGSPERRQPIDLATMAWWPPEAATELAPLLRKSLRVTDQVIVDDEGLKVLLLGCDEVGAIRALQRVPVPPPVLRLATGSDVLAGAFGPSSQ